MARWVIFRFSSLKGLGHGLNPKESLNRVAIGLVMFIYFVDLVERKFFFEFWSLFSASAVRGSSPHKGPLFTCTAWRAVVCCWSRLLCTGHLKIWRPIELHTHAPLKITSNRRCQENRERVSAGDRQTKSSNKNLKTMFFSISKSDKRKKKGERSMYTVKKFFRHCSCLWRRATAGL